MELAQEFTPLNPTHHNVKHFCCGKPPMDDFLRRNAAKHMKLGVSNTWVLPVLEEPQPEKPRIAAYYTLTPNTVQREEIPYNRSLPRYPVPVVLLARLAVDEEFAKKGLGEKTLVTALRKSVELTDAGAAAVGVIVDVLDEDALKFYQEYEIFDPFTDDPMRLFAPMHTLRQL